MQQNREYCKNRAEEVKGEYKVTLTKDFLQLRMMSKSQMNFLILPEKW